MFELRFRMRKPIPCGTACKGGFRSMFQLSSRMIHCYRLLCQNRSGSRRAYRSAPEPQGLGQRSNAVELPLRLRRMRSGARQYPGNRSCLFPLSALREHPWLYWLAPATLLWRSRTLRNWVPYSEDCLSSYDSWQLQFPELYRSKPHVGFQINCYASCQTPSQAGTRFGGQ
jgi:hypothetical protein